MNLKYFFDRDKKLLIKVIAGVLLLVIAFAFYLMKNAGSEKDMVLSEIPEEEIQSREQTTEAAIDEKVMIIVDVGGAVANPSVVELPEGSRVYEAIDIAGGLTQGADTRNTNQAEILTDGQKLYIPTKEELESKGSGTSENNFQSSAIAGSSGLININTADSVMLQELTGVGPATAEKIINYRNQNGKFKSIEDIRNVSGIGNKTFEKFKNKITV